MGPREAFFHTYSHDQGLHSASAATTPPLLSLAVGLSWLATYYSIYTGVTAGEGVCDAYISLPPNPPISKKASPAP